MATSQTVKLNLDTREFDRGISKATAALGALVSAATIGKIVQTTARFQDLQTTLGSVFGSAQKGAQAFKNVQELSTRTQFSVEDLSTTFVKLAGAGIQPTEELLRTFTDAAAVTTDQVGSLTAITDLFARTTAGGLGLEDLNRLADRGLPVFDILNEKLGLSRTEISKFGQSAEGAQKILGALQQGIEERFGGATANRLQNLSTLMSNFSIALTNAAANIGAAMTPALGGLIQQVTTMIENSDKLTTALGTGLAFAFETVGHTIQFVGDNMSIFVGIATAATVAVGARGLTRALNAAKVAMIGLNRVIKANPIGLLATAVTALIGYLAFENGLGKTLAQVKAAVDVLGRAFSAFATFIREKVSAVINKLKDIFLGFVQSAIDGYNTLADFLPLLDRFEGDASDLTGVVVQLGKDGLEYASGKANELGEAIKNAVPEEVVQVYNDVTKAVVETGEAYDEAEKMLKKANKAQTEWAQLTKKEREQVTQKPVSTAQLEKQAQDLQKRFEQLKESLFTEEEAETASYNKKLALLDEYYKGRQHFDKEYARLRETLETQHQRKLQSIAKAQTQEQLDIFKSGEFAKLDFSKLSNDQMKEFTIGAGKEVLGALAQQNKQAFEAQKALQIAQAVMNVATGVTKALAQGGIFGPILAGLVIAAGAAQIATIRSQKYQGRATGGLVQGNQPYVVGERGPEMFVPSQTGTILPNGNMNGGSKNVNVTFNIETIDATGFDELLTERKSTITNIIRDAAFEKGERSPV